jgi:flagella basal body P-ring formation protein FlgA
MYAVDRSRQEELNRLLAETGFSPANKVRRYPDDPQQVDARERLLSSVTESRTNREDLVQKGQAADTQPENLCAVPGSGHQARQKKRKRDELPPRRSPREVRELCDEAIAKGQHIEMLYVTRDQQRKHVRLAPERVAVNQQGQQVLVARDLEKDERLSYQVVQIERMALFKPKAAR